jgi:hypothetical protein
VYKVLPKPGKALSVFADACEEMLKKEGLRNADAFCSLLTDMFRYTIELILNVRVSISELEDSYY